MTSEPAPDPVVAEVVRDGLVESRHRGRLAVTGPDGAVEFARGDVHSTMYPRSSNKPLQALGMLRAGLTIDTPDLALACASHSGQPGHAERVVDLLHAHGLGEGDLACPPEYPQHEPSMIEAVRTGAGRRRETMNCSGKHAAMLATCVQRGWPVQHYTDPKHPLQQSIAETVVELAAEPITHTTVDGCGAPLFAFSLAGLARSFSCLAGAADGPRRRVADAMRAHPWLVAGSSQTDTLLMLGVPGLIAKRGAEAVQAVALPDGTTIAVKVDDGGRRALAPVVLTALRALGERGRSEAARAVLDGLRNGTNEVLGAGKPLGGLHVPEGLLPFTGS